MDLSQVSSWGTIIGFGSALGFIIAYATTKEHRKQVDFAHKDQVDTLTQTINNQKELILAIETTHKEHFEKLEVEKELYKDQKHNLANDLQAARLIIQEYKLRPDLTKIEQFYENLLETQKMMLSVVMKVEEDHKQHSDVCGKTAIILNNLVKRLEQKNILP